MKTIFRLISLLSVLLCLVSCEKEKSGILDLNFATPFIPSLNLNHSSLNLTNDSTGSVEKIDSSTYRITIIFNGNVIKYSTEAPSKGRLQLFKTGDTSPFTRTSFNIQPTGTDTFTFSQSVSFIIQNTDVGFLRFEFIVETASGKESNLVQRSLLIFRGVNHTPILFNVDVPDTVVLPPLDSLLIKMTAAVSDSDGMGDIKEVFFFSLNSSNPQRKFPLYDDGGLSSNPPSGDQLAGDGIYTIIVKLVDDPFGPPVRKTYTFEFHAIDKQDSSSAPVQKNITVQ